MKRIYLDNNATTFLDADVIKTLEESLHQHIGNPSSPHFFGQIAKGLLSKARKTIADFLKVKQNQVIFTSGGSEGAQLSILGILANRPKGHLICSNVEHACVYEIYEDLKAEGYDVTYLPTGSKGYVTPLELQQSIRPDTQLISLMAVNNETGVKNDIEALGKIAEASQIPFVVDGVALLGKEHFQIPKTVSAIFFSGHKIHALQGVGFVVRKEKFPLVRQIKGGFQEFSLRGGTENLLGIISLAKAIEMLTENQADYIKQIEEMRDYFEKRLLKLPGISVNGTGARICNTVNLQFDGVDGETLLILLDQKGIAASLGSACSSGAIEPSRILLNMGLSVRAARSSLRFSFSRQNTLEEIEEAVSIIEKLYPR